MVALGVEIYTCNLSHSMGVDIFPAQVKYRFLTLRTISTLHFPLFKYNDIKYFFYIFRAPLQMALSI